VQGARWLLRQNQNFRPIEAASGSLLSSCLSAVVSTPELGSTEHERGKIALSCCYGEHYRVSCTAREKGFFPVFLSREVKTG
jgi:hypothetical protein